MKSLSELLASVEFQCFWVWDSGTPVTKAALFADSPRLLTLTGVMDRPRPRVISAGVTNGGDGDPEESICHIPGDQHVDHHHPVMGLAK